MSFKPRASSYSALRGSPVMTAASKGAPPQWLSPHLSGNTRIADIEANLPKVLPLYARSQDK
ncbi:hypothetical protein [Rhodoferax sp.]|uniref:hypothetical protein n=1 Tax=Rhodoferax sp. TaxID=50421 RepID=UPI00345B7BBE